MSSNSPFAWQETTPGQYERDIDAVEAFYTSVAKAWEGIGRTYFAMVSTVAFTVKTSDNLGNEEMTNRVVAAFQSAWKTLRYRFPTMASEVIYDSNAKKCKKVYNKLLNEQDIDSWMGETFFVYNDIASWKAFMEADETVGRFARMHLSTAALDTPKEGEPRVYNILFRCRHDLLDGIGTLKFLNHLLDEAAAAFMYGSAKISLLNGDEHNNLSPPLEVACGLRPAPSKQQLEDFVAIQAINNEARQSTEVIGFPGTIKASRAGRSQYAGIKLTPKEATNILDQCKGFGVTVTHLFHTAIALALGYVQDRTEAERKARYITYALMNLRGICGDARGPDLHPVSVLHSVSVNNLVVDLTIPSISDADRNPSRDELLTALHQVSSFYQNLAINDDLISTIPHLFKRITPAYSEEIAPVPEPSTARSVSLSSLGMVDKLISQQHGPFLLEDIFVASGEYSTGVGLFLGTFNGVMSLDSAYNEAFHSEVCILAFLEKVKGFAMDILGAMKS